MIIGIITANSALVPIDFVQSLIRLKKYDFIIQKGPSIPDNRNRVMETAKLLNEDLLFIDSDMTFTPEDVDKIEKHLQKYDIVSGVYKMNFDTTPLAVFNTTLKVLHETPNEMFEIGGCGAGFLGISKKVIATISEPFTLIKYEKTGQVYGEDISFCLKARDNGFSVMCDPSIKLGHIKSKILTV